MDARFFRTILAAILLCLTALPRLGFADCIDYGSYMHIIAWEPLGAVGVSFTVSGNYAYVACSSFGLEVVDVSDPTYPRLISGVHTQNARDVAVSGSYAYVNDYFNIKIFNIADPVHPKVVAQASSWEGSGGIAISGSYLYVASGAHGMRVIDVANPLQPTFVMDFDTPGSATSIEISGSYAYVTDGSAGLEVIDISNPLSPMIVGNLNTPVTRLSISGSYAYMSDAGGILQVVDISDPASPTIVSTGSNVSVGSSRIFADGSVVYAVSFVLMAFDVSNPAHPILAGMAQLPSGAGNDVVATGSYAYVIESGPGHFDVFDVTNAAAPSPVLGTVPASGAVGVSGTHAYTTGGPFQVIDISDPLIPTITGTLTLPASGGAIVIQDSYAYVLVSGGTLYIIDISDPNAPTLAGSVGSVAGQSLAVSGSYAYIGNSGIIVIDVSNHSTPVVVKRVHYTGAGSAIALYGSYAYVGGLIATDIYNISVPSNPILLSAANVSGGVPQVSGSRLFMTPPSQSGVLKIYSLTVPTAPTLLGSVDNLGIVWSVAISGYTAYVATSAFAVHAVDVTNPTLPQDLGNLALADGARSIATSVSNLYVIGGTNLSVLPLQCPGLVVPVLLSSFQADSGPGAITLHWTTSTDLAGFHVYRSESGNLFQRVNSSLIPGPGPYAFRDEHIETGHLYRYRLEAVDREGESTFLGPYVVTTSPVRNRLGMCRPNPFQAGSTSSRIDFETGHAGRTTLRILDVTGAKVRVLVDDASLPAGPHVAMWDGRDERGQCVASGTYFYRLVSGSFSKTERLVLTR